MFNIKMTPAEALDIQAKQVAHYSKYRSDLAEVVKSLTNVEGIDLNAPMSIFEINERIPRGGRIEHLCGLNFSD